jgi:cytosine/adenosine deaminase-related metal-dependent hydrolase
MATVYFARWLLLPDGAIVENGALAVDGATIVAAGSRSQVARRPGDRAVNLGGLLLLPGLINLHTHLEEAALRGAARQSEEPFSSYVVKKQARLRQADEAAVLSAVRLADRKSVV